MHKENKQYRIRSCKRKDIDVVTPMYNLIKYSDNYSETSASLLRYYGDELVLNVMELLLIFLMLLIVLRLKLNKK